MTVAKFNQPDASAQTGTNYKANIDASIQVLMQLAANFAAHALDVPDMRVMIDAGKVWNGKTHVIKSAQTTYALTVPSTNPRIDRIAINVATGAYYVIAGTEAATPVPPDYTFWQYPVCQVMIVPGQTSITNADIIDERPVITPQIPMYRGALVTNNSAPYIASDSGTTYTMMQWDTVIKDTDGIFDINYPTQLHVPVGASVVRIRAHISWGGLFPSGQAYVTLFKNGGFAIDGSMTVAAAPAQAQEGSPQMPNYFFPIPLFETGPIDVLSNGINYFELGIRQDSGSNKYLEGGGTHTWMELEVLSN